MEIKKVAGGVREVINTESVISSLFVSGHTEVDYLLFSYTLKVLFDNCNLYTFEPGELSPIFNKYIKYSNGAFRLKDGLTIYSNISRFKKQRFPLSRLLKTNINLVRLFSDEAFKTVVTNQINEEILTKSL